MEFEDRYVTSTPEGVTLELVLAGLGSRFVAYLVDFIVVAAAEVALVLAFAAASGARPSTTTTDLLAGTEAVLAFAIAFGYFIVFETLDNGRSIGKRMVGLRVVLVGGGAVGFRASLLRNLARLVDMMPGVFYLVGSVLVLATRRNQRLGDLLAGTLVIRQRLAAATAAPRDWSERSQWARRVGWVAPPPAAVWLPPELAVWDVTAVGAEELTLVHMFLANRSGYSPEARARLAYDLAARLWPKVAGPTATMDAERFLEAVAWVKAARR